MKPNLRTWFAVRINKAIADAFVAIYCRICFVVVCRKAREHSFIAESGSVLCCGVLWEGPGLRDVVLRCLLWWVVVNAGVSPTVGSYDIAEAWDAE